MANVLNRSTFEYLPSVHTPDYPPSQWLINPDLSAVEGQPRIYWKIVDDEVQLMDQAERDAVDAGRISEVKKAKAEEIDATTDYLISQGFEHAGRRFSLSNEAQLTLNGLYIGREDPQWQAAYPYAYNSIDDLDALTIAGPEDIAALWNSARAGLAVAIVSGTQLKELVRSATTVAEVEAIVDPRV